MKVYVGDLVKYWDCENSEGFGLVVEVGRGSKVDEIVIHWFDVKGEPNDPSYWKRDWLSSTFGESSDYYLKVVS